MLQGCNENATEALVIGACINNIRNYLLLIITHRNHSPTPPRTEGWGTQADTADNPIVQEHAGAGGAPVCCISLLTYLQHLQLSWARHQVQQTNFTIAYIICIKTYVHMQPPVETKHTHRLTSARTTTHTSTHRRTYI